jgi:2-hydroxychromene-2-carboxylate isomerase
MSASRLVSIAHAALKQFSIIKTADKFNHAVLVVKLPGALHAENKHNMTMPSVLDFWFEFASTYSYPATMRIAPLAREAGVTVRFRPFLLGPVFQTQGWRTSPFNLYVAKGGNMWRDLERLCADLKLSFRRPEPFPQNSLLAARVALIGLDTTWGEQFCRAVFLAEFCEGFQIGDPAVLSDILVRLNVEPDPVLDAAGTDTNKARLRAQTEEAQRLGIFGAPSFTTADGELFWGNDRLERALAWAKNGC